MGKKLNLGASPIWQGEGWHVLDHKLTKNEGHLIAGDAVDINLPDESCDVVFCSHVFEHIPHTRLPRVLAEINRVLVTGGVLRVLTPDLERVARAYVEGDKEFFRLAKEEDTNIRTDIGLGGTFMNFIVSPGQDTVLLDRGLNNFIAGYAHLYCYDYEMLSTIMRKIGFKTRRASFNDSKLEEMQVPLHVKGLKPVWQNFNQKLYDDNQLTHRLVDGKYEINFNVAGFDRDPLTSLIVEAEKYEYVTSSKAEETFNQSDENYNKYAYSLLSDENFVEKLDGLGLK